MTGAKQKEYDDIPGTFVFDADRSREGYHLNMFCMSLMKAENRKAFKENEAEYLERFPMTPEQRQAILKRDYNRMLELGGNIYFTAKLGATDGHSFQHMAAVDDRLDPGGLRRDDARRRPLDRRQSQQIEAGQPPRTPARKPTAKAAPKRSSKTAKRPTRSGSKRG